MIEPEIEAAEVPVVPRPVLLRQCTILLGGETEPPEILADPEYPVGAFEVLDEELGVASSIAVIAIGEIDKRVLVAFPQEAWHRTLAKRRLPYGSLLKAVAASVGFCDRRANLAEEVDNKKIWIGFLSPAAEDRVVFPEGEEYPEPDIAFDPSSPEILPIAKDLHEVVEKLFQFTSATSGGEWHAPQSASTFDQRMVALEATVSEIAESLKNLTVDQGSNHRKPALRKPEVTFAPTSKAPSMAAAASSMAPPPGLQAPNVAGLDWEVVQSARQAGIPEQQILEMAKLASRGKPRMQDLPERRARPKVANPLSESEDEETEAAEDENQGGGDAGKLVTAVSQLTKIASHLTKQKNRNKDLDSLLDGAGSAHSTDSSSIPSSRRYAAALRALRKMLRDRPKDIYEAVETNMEADFQVRTQMPGSEAVAVSARAWLELRSRVQNYGTPVRLLWGIAGVMDCLKQGLVPEARARCALLLAAGDQLSVDRGSWIVAQEILLEECPPFGAFNLHQLPTETEPPHTRLIDGRWIDLFVQKISDYDSLAEKKKKLGRGRGLPLPDPPIQDPKGRGKGRGKGKGGGGSAEGQSDPVS